MASAPLSIQRQYELQGNLMREEWLFSRYLNRKRVQRAASLGAGEPKQKSPFLNWVQSSILISLMSAQLE